MADRRLQVFHTVARLLSFTKAAETLHMTQPAVTFQVRQLEEQFNTRLFDRTHNKVTLTDVGKQVYSYSERILKLYEEMTRNITEMTARKVKKLVGLGLFQTSVFILYITMGYLSGGQAPIIAEGVTAYSSPLPHVLILTAIVVGVATTAVGLALVVRIYEAYGTVEEDQFHTEDLANDEALLDADVARQEEEGR